MSQWQMIGAQNNACWCDLIVRSHLGLGVFADDAWTSPMRTPPLFPDAVSLIPFPRVDDLLSRVDASPGCTIKDSFACLDLTRYGFSVLFDARWITSPAYPDTTVRLPAGLTQISEPQGLEAWERAWCHDERPTGLFRSDLLVSQQIAVLGLAQREQIIAGGIVSRSRDAVGLSNVFTAEGDPSRTWSLLAQGARALFPRLPLVGYERGEDLANAQANGFRTAGPLRIWIAPCDEV